MHISFRLVSGAPAGLAARAVDPFVTLPPFRHPGGLRASVLAAAPDRGPGQAPAVRPPLHRLRRLREPWMGPRLRGDIVGFVCERGGKGPRNRTVGRTAIQADPRYVQGAVARRPRKYACRNKTLPKNSPALSGSGRRGRSMPWHNLTSCRFNFCCCSRIGSPRDCKTRNRFQCASRSTIMASAIRAVCKVSQQVRFAKTGNAPGNSPDHDL